MRLATLAAALRRAGAAAPREAAFPRAAPVLRAAFFRREPDAAERVDLRVGFFRTALFGVAVLRRGRLVVWRADRTAFPRVVAVFFFFGFARAAVVVFPAFPRTVVFFFRLGAALPVRDRLEARARLRLWEPADLRLRVEDVFRPLAV